jgi:aryl-alcohol dehydrogenase-like predicted oxidoreductase
VLHRGEDFAPIPGTRRIERLEENAAAAEIELTRDDLDAIDASFPASEVQGGRYA